MTSHLGTGKLQSFFYSASTALASDFSADGSDDIWFGKYAGTIHDIATRKKILYALAASCMQSSQFFASTLQEKLFEFKNEDAIKKWENLRDTLR